MKIYDITGSERKELDEGENINHSRTKEKYMWKLWRVITRKRTKRSSPSAKIREWHIDIKMKGNDNNSGTKKIYHDLIDRKEKR